MTNVVAEPYAFLALACLTMVSACAGTVTVRVVLAAAVVNDHSTGVRALPAPSVIPALSPAV